VCGPKITVAIRRDNRLTVCKTAYLSASCVRRSIGEARLVTACCCDFCVARMRSMKKRSTGSEHRIAHRKEEAGRLQRGSVEPVAASSRGHLCIAAVAALRWQYVPCSPACAAPWHCVLRQASPLSRFGALRGFHDARTGDGGDGRSGKKRQRSKRTSE